MKPRVLPLIVASLTLVVATALLASAEETKTSSAPSNFAESLRAIVDVEGLDPSDYFQLEVYGDNFWLADRIYYKLDLNPKIDEATREKIADFLYANNIAFALYLQSGDKEVVYIAPSNEISVDKTKFRAIKQAHLDPAFGFPIYERLLGENARQSFPLSGRQNSEDESTPDSLSFRIAARPVAIENDEARNIVPCLDLPTSTSRELKLRLNERDLATPLVNDKLDIALEAIAERIDRDDSNDEYLAALLREFDVLLKSKKDYVRAYYYSRASRLFRSCAKGRDSRGALSRQIEKMEEIIGLRAIPFRDEREKVGTNGETTNETSWLNSIFEIKTSKRSYRYGEDVFFKIDFKEGVELEKRKEVIDQLQTNGLAFTIFLRERETLVHFRDSALMKLFNCPNVGTSLSVKDGFPVYERVRSEDVVASLRDSSLVSIDGARARTTDKNVPCDFNFELVLSENNKAFSPAVASEEIAIEPVGDVGTESSATDQKALQKLRDERGLFETRDRKFEKFRLGLLEPDENEALRRLGDLEIYLKNCEEYQRAYFLQRVVVTLRKFMGIDKCPELQKKRAQYEEELGLQWIQR